MKTNLLIGAIAMVGLVALTTCGTAGAAPLAIGMKFGVDFGPTVTNTPGNDWNDITTNNGGIAAGSVINLAGAVLDGVSIATSNSQFTNNDGTDNWIGLAVNGGSAPPEFTDSVVTDITGNFSLGDNNPFTVTINGLNTAFRYEIWAVTTAPNFDLPLTEQVSIIGASTVSSAILRSESRLDGKFHHFTGLEASASGQLRIEVVDVNTTTNPILNAVLIAAIPEPSSLCLLGMAFGGVGLAYRRRRK